MLGFRVFGFLVKGFGVRIKRLRFRIYAFEFGV